MLFKRDFYLTVLNINTFKLFEYFVCKSYNSKYGLVSLYSLQQLIILVTVDPSFLKRKSPNVVDHFSTNVTLKCGVSKMQ